MDLRLKLNNYQNVETFVWLFCFISEQKALKMDSSNDSFSFSTLFLSQLILCHLHGVGNLSSDVLNVTLKR